MRTVIKLILALLILAPTLRAHAATKDWVSPGNCYFSYPFEMVIAEKHGNQYLVSTSVAGSDGVGVVTMTVKTKFMAYNAKTKTTSVKEERIVLDRPKGWRLNIGVMYMSTKTVQGTDGYEHSIDYWQECQMEN